MMLASPTFIDETGYFPEQNIKTAFYALNESLLLNWSTLGDELYARLSEMSGHMRARFEADPNHETGETRRGRALIEDMSDLLIQRIRQSKQAKPT
jgi:hypothetical protein